MYNPTDSNPINIGLLCFKKNYADFNFAMFIKKHFKEDHCYGQKNFLITYAPGLERWFSPHGAC